MTETTPTWVEGAAGSLFDLDNLPYGVFSTAAATAPAWACASATTCSTWRRSPRPRWADPASALAAAWRTPSLNAFMATGAEQWADRPGVDHRGARQRRAPARTAPHLHPLADVELHLPVEVGDYVDFYASEHHASNVGRIFRPDQEPLLPNWKHLPVGYHGRAGTVVPSGTDIVRPVRPAQGARPRTPRRTARAAGSTSRPSSASWSAPRRGSASGSATADFAAHTFGVVGLNDWSARDIQAWEYVPLGPFLGKSFATSISHWVTPLAALDAAWTDLPGQDPEPLDYLRVERARRARHRDRGGARRRGRLPPAVRLDVLVARRRCSPTPRSTAPPCAPATCGARAPSPAPRSTSAARCWSCAGAARSRSPPAVASAPSSRTATR